MSQRNTRSDGHSLSTHPNLSWYTANCALIWLLALLQVFDTVTTEYMISLHGVDIERNPLIRMVFIHGGWFAVLIIKLVAVYGIWILREGIKLWAGMLLWLAVIVYIVIVSRSMYVILT